MKSILKYTLILVGVCVLCSSLYTQDERERAVVYQWGTLKYERTDAGLHTKLPWPIQSVSFLEKRWFPYHASPHEVLTKDKKALLIDTVAYVRISDGIKFIRNVQTLENAQARLDDIAYSQMRKSLGQHNLEDVVVKDRITIQDDVERATSAQLQECCGLESAFVRVVRTDFPNENKDSVFARMRAERGRIASGYRSDGDEQAQRIRADADRQATVIVAEAQEESQKNRGIGDAEATRIYSEAYSKDPKFFAFWRGLQAVEKTADGSPIQFIENGKEPHWKVLFGDTSEKGPK